jgi:hypothetical protein
LLEIPQFGTDDGSRLESLVGKLVHRHAKQSVEPRWTELEREHIELGRIAPVGRVAACKAPLRRSGERSLGRPHPRGGRCTGLADRIRETGRAERRSGMRPPRQEYGLDAAESSERSLVVGARERLVRGSSRLPSCNMHYNWRAIVMDETLARAPKPNSCAAPDGGVRPHRCAK